MKKGRRAIDVDRAERGLGFFSVAHGCGRGSGRPCQSRWSRLFDSISRLDGRFLWSWNLQMSPAARSGATRESIRLWQA